MAERRVVATLSALPGSWTVLHDRLLRPGRPDVVLDHVIVGPGGMFLVEVTTTASQVTERGGGLVEDPGGGGRPGSGSLGGALAKVHGLAAYVSVEAESAVTPVLCLAGRRGGDLGEPRRVGGVWVVPLPGLVGWLEGRPQVLDPVDAELLVLHAATAFPSMTVDADLRLAARPAPGRRRHSHRRPQGREVAVPPSRSVITLDRPAAPHVGRPPLRPLGRWAAVVGATVLVLVVVVGIWTSLHASGVAAGGTTPASAGFAPMLGPAGASADVTGAAGAQPVDCSRVTPSQIATILGRTVQPVVTSSGCAWGTRLDDPSTILVSLLMSTSHSASDTQLVASAAQHRVVYGTSVDLALQPATELWVAGGQPIGTGATQVTALADTTVVVSTAALGLGDDQARAVALAVAGAANASR